MADMKTNAPADFYFQKSHYSPFVHGWKGDPVKTQTKQASPPVEPQLPKTLTWVPKATNIITASFVQ